MLQTQLKTCLQLAFCVLVFSTPLFTSAQEKPTIYELKNRAVQSAVQKVSKAIVRLNIFSSDPNRPKVGTGVVVSPDGYLLTSSFFTSQRDEEFVVEVGENKLAAQLIAVDHSRELSLLRVSPSRKLDFIEFKPTECQIGETAIAIGRTLSPSAVNVSTGIVSAKNRIWGKALQTDAKISPANYGGLLVKLNGQIMGMLTSISADPSGVVNASEWYDSGIGFAIPSSDISNSWPKLKTKKDLAGGVTGICFESQDLFHGKLVISHCFPRSPAQLAGILPGDRITKINKETISNLRQFKRALGPLYADQRISLEIQRDKEILSLNLKLVDRLSIYQIPYLGVILTTNPRESIVEVHKVDQKSSANAKLFPGDIIERVNGKTISSEKELRSALAQSEAGQKIELVLDRAQKAINVELSLGKMTQPLAPSSFPTATPTSKLDLVTSQLRISGYPNRCQLTLPQQFDNEQSVRLLVILATSSKENEAIQNRFRFLAESYNTGLMMIFPQSLDGWQQNEREVIELAIQKTRTETPEIDSCVIFSRSSTVKVAAALVTKRRESIRGWIVAEPTETDKIIWPAADPRYPLFSLVITNKKSMTSGNNVMERLRENGIPVQRTSAIPSEKLKFVDDMLKDWIHLLDRI